MPEPTREAVKAALSRQVIKLFDLEDWMLRGVANSVMLIHSMPETRAADDDVKWRTTINLHRKYIDEAYAVHLERRCLYGEMREYE